MVEKKATINTPTDSKMKAVVELNRRNLLIFLKTSSEFAAGCSLQLQFVHRLSLAHTSIILSSPKTANFSSSQRHFWRAENAGGRGKVLPTPLKLSHNLRIPLTTFSCKAIPHSPLDFSTGHSRNQGSLHQVPPMTYQHAFHRSLKRRAISELIPTQPVL